MELIKDINGNREPLREQKISKRDEHQLARIHDTSQIMSLQLGRRPTT